MKNFISIFLVICCYLSTYAQEQVTNYQNSYWDKSFSIEASLKNNKIDRIFISVMADNARNASIIIAGDDLYSFKSALSKTKEKYVEWQQIAIDNNVTDMTKEFGINFPDISFGWYSSKWWFSFFNTLNMKFSILESGKIVAMANPKVTASSNRYISEQIYFVFGCAQDFDNLINALDKEQILKRLNDKQSKEDLFQ